MTAPLSDSQETARPSLLARADSAIRRRTLAGWIAFRVVAGTLVALGLFSWLTVWFQRGFWLGMAQTVMCGLVLLHELGMLGGRRSRSH